MADQQNTIKTTVELDASQAQIEIVKLNAKASDSTKTLQERVEAKNKAVKLQDDLSKKIIKDLEDESDRLKKLEGTNIEFLKVQKKLQSARLKATKASESGKKQQEKLTQSLKDSQNATKNLDDATGGLLGKMKAFVANPIGLVIIAIAAAFKTVQAAVQRSGKATEAFNKIGAKLSGILNGLLAVLEPVVEFLGDKLLAALNDPMQAIKDLGDSIKENLINRLNSFMVVGEAFSLLMKGEFKKAAKVGADALIQFTTGVTNATDKIIEFGKEAKKNFDEAAAATERLANAERQLARNRIALEKQQLTSLRLAEEQRQIRDDVSKDMDERIAANVKLGQILEAQAVREIAIAQQNLDLARLDQQANGETVESIEKIGDAEIKLLEIRERITGQRSEQLVNENSLLKEQADLKLAELAELEKFREAESAYDKEQAQKKLEEKEKAEEERLSQQEIQNELDKLEIERLAEQGGKVLDLELALLETKRKQDVAAKGITEKEIQLINERSELEKDKIRKISEKLEKEKEDAILSNAIDGAAESFGIAQEVAVAKMIMAAPEAVAGSFKQAAQSYVPPLSLVMGAIGAAGTIIPIIKGLSDIKKTRFSKKRGGAPGGSISSSTGGNSASASVTPEVVSNIAANNASRLGSDTQIGNEASGAAANNVLGGASQGIVFSESKYTDFKTQVAFKEEKTTIG